MPKWDDDFDFEDEQDDDGTLDKATVDAIRRGTSAIPDVEAAERLLDQVSALMVSVSTVWTIPASSPRRASASVESSHSWASVFVK